MVYTFYNPDIHPCFYLSGAAYTRAEIDYEPWLAGAYDVAYYFKVWCGVGIVISSTLMLYGVLGFVFRCSKRVSVAKLANCFLILGYSIAFVWMIFGVVLRYNNPGRVCSGDYGLQRLIVVDVDWDEPSTYAPYLLRTGELINTLLIAMLCFYSCLCGCGLCACVAVASGYRRELI